MTLTKHTEQATAVIPLRIGSGLYSDKCDITTCISSVFSVIIFKYPEQPKWPVEIRGFCKSHTKYEKKTHGEHIAAVVDIR